MEGASTTNKPEGSVPSNNEQYNKPTNAVVKSGRGRWLGLKELLQLAVAVVFMGCLYPVYNHITTLSAVVAEYQKQIRKIESKVTSLQADLASLTDKETQMKRNFVDVPKEEWDAMSVFVKEFHKNFSVAKTISENDQINIKYLYNFANVLNETLSNVKERIYETQRFEKSVGCQSGNGVGEFSFPHILYQFERTVNFDPPFSSAPAFTYGIYLLDTKTPTSIDVQLLSVTQGSARLKFINLSEKQSRGFCGVRISWMACPK